MASTFGQAVTMPYALASAFTLLVYTIFLEQLELMETAAFSEFSVPTPPNSLPGLSPGDWIAFITYPFELIIELLGFFATLFSGYGTAVGVVPSVAAPFVLLAWAVPTMIILIWAVPVMTSVASVAGRLAQAVGGLIPFT